MCQGGKKDSFEDLDTFDGAKPRFLNRDKERRSVSTPAYRQAERSAETSASSVEPLTPKPYPGLQTGESNGLIF
jgi:hypothetical protein